MHFCVAPCKLALAAMCEHLQMEHLSVNKAHIRDHLRAVHTDADLRAWFDPLAFHFSDSGTIEVCFPHALFSRWFSKEKRKLLERSLAHVYGAHARIIYAKPNNGRTPTLQKRLTDPAPLPGKDYAQWSFETFIYNKKNEFPVAMAKEMAASPSNPAYIPFVISGKGTCGKTHLLRAIAHGMAESIPHASMYIGAAEELNALFAETGKTAFRRKMLRCKAIFIDNAQDLALYPDLQQVLLPIEDAFREKKKPFVVAVDENFDRAAFDQKLQSRLESGLVVTVKKPDLDVRLRYVKAQCAANRLHLKKEFLLVLAQRFHNLRTIQGTVTKLSAYQKRTDKALSSSEFEKIITTTSNLSGSPASPAAVINQVAESFALSPEEVTGVERRSDIVLARQTAMYLCRELLGVSYSALGEYFNGKNHATVLYACKKIKKTIDSDKSMHKKVTQIRKKFLSSSG